MRDVILYGTFDGASHKVLAQIEVGLRQMVKMPASSPAQYLDIIKKAYTQPTTNLVQIGRKKAPFLYIPLPYYLPALADHATQMPVSLLIDLSQIMWGLVQQSQQSKLWEQNKGWRFSLIRQAAYLELLVAMVELSDIGCRQKLIGKEEAMAAILTAQQPIYQYAFGWFGGAIATALRRLSAESDDLLPPSMPKIEHVFAGIARQARIHILDNLACLTL